MYSKLLAVFVSLSFFDEIILVLVYWTRSPLKLSESTIDMKYVYITSLQVYIDIASHEHTHLYYIYCINITIVYDALLNWTFQWRSI